ITYYLLLITYYLLIMIELLSVHIPKTAGTAFRHALEEAYGMNGVIGDYPPNKIHQPDSQITYSAKVIHGHFLPKKYQGYYPQAKRIVWLRHPIFRLISEYFFAKTIKDHENAIHAQLLNNNLNILEFAQIPAMRNFLAKHIKGIKLQEFDFVGIQEFYQEDLQDLQKIMEWPKVEPIIKNNNLYHKYQKSLQEILSNTTLINQISRLNLEDLQLYQNALNLRAKRRQESVLIQSTLAEYQRSQFLIHQLQQDLSQAKLETQQINYWLNKYITPSKEIDFIPTSETKFRAGLIGFHIDCPLFPIFTSNKIININGWVIGKNAAASKIEIRHNSKVLAETSVDLSRPDVAQVYGVSNAQNSGFAIALASSAIPSQTKLTIEVILTNRECISLGTLNYI
ncbi:sulfotransferase family 2 domain-containing protein, partial [Xenococcus sp. PCC 7305]|uniref:sulfotransferase family 2 domain-containing protein n=1 Tax=Xenococcus sp. PCC 7305 TaxID=102125 RepID=UPI001EE6A8E9